MQRMGSCAARSLLRPHNAAAIWLQNEVVPAMTLQSGRHQLFCGQYPMHPVQPRPSTAKGGLWHRSETPLHRQPCGPWTSASRARSALSTHTGASGSNHSHPGAEARSQRSPPDTGLVEVAGGQRQAKRESSGIPLKLAGGGLLAASLIMVVSLRRSPCPKNRVLQNRCVLNTSQVGISRQKQREEHLREDETGHKDRSRRSLVRANGQPLPHASVIDVEEQTRAAGLVWEHEDNLKQERLLSELQAGPSNGVNAPIIELVWDLNTGQTGRLHRGGRRQMHPTETIGRLSKGNSDAEEKLDGRPEGRRPADMESAVAQYSPGHQGVVAPSKGPFSTRTTWASGVEPGGSPFFETTPPIENDGPFASRIFWDSGMEPGDARGTHQGEAVSKQRAGLKRDSRPSRESGIQFCSFGRRKGNSFVRAAAERVGPSVVRLNTERSPLSGKSGRDLFTKFFGGEDLILEERPKDREQGQGSGFVVDGRRGIIATNAHVVNRADTVLVTFTDGRTYKGAVIGTDELTDLAVIKVDLTPGEVLPDAPLGNSNSLEIGDWVIAVGNPFGLDSTVTLGILSSLHRQAAEIGIPEKRVDFLQTDCAINPGNSGGPLLNEFGEVVGINTAIRADAEGISFAIPINYARKVIDVLSQGVPMRHAYIGVQVVMITPELARRHNSDAGSRGLVPEARGVLVVKVADGSPAEAAGLLSGDVILEMNGRPLRSTGELQSHVAYSDVGQVIRVIARRGSQNIVMVVVAGDLTPLLFSNGTGKA